MTISLLMLGLLIGLVMAVTGAGGGILGVPLLVLVTGLTVQEAIPIALLAVFFAALSGAIIGGKKGYVRYRATLLIALLGVILSPLGLWLGHQLDSRWLNLIFALLLLILAMRSLMKKGSVFEDEHAEHIPCIRDEDTGRFKWTSRCARYLGISGGVAGFMSGLLGVGGGFVIVPALQKYTDLNMVCVVATSLAITTIISFTVVVTSAIAGKLETVAAWPFVAGALLGIIVGYRIARRLNRQQTQKIFAYLLIAIACLMVGKSW